MKRISIGGLSALLVLTLVAGCREAETVDPLLPSDTIEGSESLTQSASPEGLSHHLWGYYLIRIDEEHFSTEVIPVRQAFAHWNVLRFLEQGPCADCVRVLSMKDSGYGTKLLDIRITHPFPTLNLTGFDVRGVAMFRGSRQFPSMGLSMPDGALGDGELINADGFTSLYYVGTELEDPTGLQSYIKGKFATWKSPDAGVNGYKRFITQDPSNTRNAFYAGTSLAATYDIDLPDSQFVIGYAVDASWVPPTTKPVTDPMTDFPPEANCPEPRKVLSHEEPIDHGLTNEGGATNLIIAVADYQGKDSHLEPAIECPELFDGTLSASFAEDGVGYSSYEVVAENAKLAPAGRYKCLIRVEDNENATSPDWLDLSAYQVHTFEVIEMPHEWTNTWGGSMVDGGDGVAIDSSGNVYVAGCFWSAVDLDPGPGEDWRISNGLTDASLSMFDSSGAFLWAKAWGGTGEDKAIAAAVDDSGNVYVTGSFEATVDFDPGPGEDQRASKGFDDVFLSKFDSSGNFAWAKTWGGGVWDFGIGVAADSSGSVYVTGSFQGTVDFDPGPGDDTHSSGPGFRDVFLSKFDSSGNFLWANTWGGSESDQGCWVAVDGSDYVYVTGIFASAVDFDPGSGTDSHTSNGAGDAFLSKFDTSGAFLSAKTWGGSYFDYGEGVAVDASGNVYVTGCFDGSVDFDPGGGEETHSSYGSYDASLSKFDSSGAFLWAKAWGGKDQDQGYSVAVDTSGNAYVTGLFRETADFDPGPGKDLHTSNGFGDVFLSKLDSSGGFLWARTWGSASNAYDDYGACVALDPSGGAYATGYFYGTTDFDPGPGEDQRTSNGESDAFLSKFAP